MGKGSKAPKPPDPGKVSAEQYKYNLAARDQNRSTTTTPFGSTQWNGNRQTINFAPRLQTLAGRLMTEANDLNKVRLDPSKFTGKEATRAIIQRLMPQLDLAREQQRNELINSGFDQNSAGYNTGMDQYNRMVNDLYLGAAQTGANVGATEYGINQAARNLPLQQILAMQGAAPPLQAPPQVAPVDYASNAYNAYNGQLQAWQQNQAGRNGALGGLFSLGGAALGAGLMPGGFLLGGASPVTSGGFSNFAGLGFGAGSLGGP